MQIGYTRVSTHDQSMLLQRDALKKAGVRKVLEDVTSGSAQTRPGLDKLLEQLRPGDTVVIWRLDRLARNLKHLIELVTHFNENKIGLKSLQENIDTTSAGGKLVLHMFGALAEFERELIRERTIAGLKAAKARGRNGGRPSVMDPKKVRMAKRLHKSGEVSVGEICRTIGISRGTFYRHVFI